MKKILFFFLALFYGSMAICQGFSITVSYKPVAKSYLYLGYYFGDKKYVQDSALIQPNGKAIFKGKEKLTGGLYIIVDEKKQRYFDLLIDKEQNLELLVDSSAFTLKKITGSSENQHLEDYQKATAKFFSNYPQWQQQMAEAKTKADSVLIQEKINAASNAAQRWRDSFCLKYSDSYLALLFRLMKEPEYTIQNAKTKEDTLQAFYNYKQQYWDQINIADERLLRTPMFEQRLNRYFENVVVRHPDSIKKEVDKFLLYSRTSKTMFRYYMNRFTNEYMNPKYMGLDVVFLHLFEKYYLTNQVDWLEAKDKQLVYNRAYSIMGNIIGEPASDLNLLDTANTPKNIYGIQSPYTLLVFWDPDCSHCREQVPKIDSFYHASWKKMGLTVVGILVDSVRSNKNNMPAVKAAWTKYIREHKLYDWVHLYQSFEAREQEIKQNIPGFRQTYDVFQTPTIYLLDKEKRIIAKKIGPDQVDDFLKHQQNKSSTNHP